MAAFLQIINFICLAVLLAANANVSAARANTRIVGGSLITIDKAPYIVQFRDKGEYEITCAGTLVAPRFVVTAAHCFNVVDFTDVYVIGGATTLTDPGVEAKVVDMILYPRYHPETMHSDLAILKLDRDLKGENVLAVPLCSRPLQAGDYLQVSGWGLTENGGDMSHQLRTAIVDVIPHSQCEKEHLKKAENGICAFVPSSKSACNGDSGGPGINAGELCGVVAFGRTCGGKYSSPVFTDVYKLRSFIEEFMSS